MGPGSLIRLRNFDHYPADGNVIRAGFTAPEGKVFVAVILGVADKRGPDEFDFLWALNDLGYYAGDQIRRHLGDDQADKLGAGIDTDRRSDGGSG
jgi:hypothetical protein